MQIKLKNDMKDDEGFVAVCPCCNEDCELQYRDYVVDFPMVWCWMCGGKFVMDFPLEEFENFLYRQHCDKIYNFSLDLLMIKKIANHPAERQYCEQQGLVHENGSYCIEDDMLDDFFNTMGRELNSYNINDITKTDPEYNLDHDGCSIHLEVIDKNGSPVKMCFYGD